MFNATGQEFHPISNSMNVKDAIIKFISMWGVVYPRELLVDTHGFLDVACIVRPTEELYAFEIKEKGDSISTGIEQCKGYQSGFDYVYIAGTVKPKKESLMRMESLGIGYVKVILQGKPIFDKEKGKFGEWIGVDANIHCLLKSPLNHPIAKIREKVLKKFIRYTEFGECLKQAEEKPVIKNIGEFVHAN